MRAHVYGLFVILYILCAYVAYVGDCSAIINVIYSR